MDGDTLSRWKYLDNLLDFCIKNDSCSSLLTHMFSIEGFSKMFEGQSADDIKDAHKKIVSAILGKINGRLLFSKSEIVVIGDKFLVRPIDSEIELEAPTIKTIDVEFIKSLSSRAINDIEQGNFDSSITKSRTLLEETFCYALENKGMKSNNKGDIGKQFKEVRELYDMHSDSDTDKRVKTLLSGLNNIVSAITEMRNRNSDAHVIGASRVKIKEHHARLFLNSSITISEFILSVVKND